MKIIKIEGYITGTDPNDIYFELLITKDNTNIDKQTNMEYKTRNPNVGKIKRFYMHNALYICHTEKRFRNIISIKDENRKQQFDKRASRSLMFIENIRIGDKIEFNAFIVEDEESRRLITDEIDIRKYSERSMLCIDAERPGFQRLDPDKQSAALIKKYNLKNIRSGRIGGIYKDKWWIDKKVIGSIMTSIVVCYTKTRSLCIKIKNKQIFWGYVFAAMGGAIGTAIGLHLNSIMRSIDQFFKSIINN